MSWKELQDIGQSLREAVRICRESVTSTAEYLQKLREGFSVPEPAQELLDRAIHSSVQPLSMLNQLDEIAVSIDKCEADTETASMEMATTEIQPDFSSRIRGFVQRLREESAQQARRSSSRQPLNSEVTVTPVDAKLVPSGATFTAVTRDISESGLSLFHTESVTAAYLAVELKDADGQPLNAVLEVVRCRPLGPLFNIGGRYVTKIHGRPHFVRNIP